MSKTGFEALRTTREDVLGVARSLTAGEWAADSDCAGWRVQDVIAHMACVFRTVVDPSSLPPGVPGDIEASQDVAVAARKDWTPEQVLADYEEMSTKGLEALAGLQDPPMAETVVPIENLGSHPLHRIANALAFDHYCHLRNDVLAPNGPIERDVDLDDELRLDATLEWLIAGLPQMAPDAMRAAVRQAITLEVTGPGGGAWTVLPATSDDGLVEVTEGMTSGASAVVRTASTDFVLWSTRRRPWRHFDVQIEGDADYAGEVLDAIHIF